MPFSSLHSEEKSMDVTIFRHLVVGVVGGCQNITGSSKMSTVLSDLSPKLALSSCDGCSSGYIITKLTKKKQPLFLSIRDIWTKLMHKTYIHLRVLLEGLQHSSMFHNFYGWFGMVVQLQFNVWRGRNFMKCKWSSWVITNCDFMTRFHLQVSSH